MDLEALRRAAERAVVKHAINTTIQEHNAWVDALQVFRDLAQPRVVFAILAERDRLLAVVEATLKFMADFGALVSESRGVDGLHLNGDVAPWDELLPGGRFEGWLLSYAAATESLAALAALKTENADAP